MLDIFAKIFCNWVSGDGTARNKEFCDAMRILDINGVEALDAISYGLMGPIILEESDKICHIASAELYVRVASVTDGADRVGARERAHATKRRGAKSKTVSDIRVIGTWNGNDGLERTTYTLPKNQWEVYVCQWCPQEDTVQVGAQRQYKAKQVKKDDEYYCLNDGSSAGKVFSNIDQWLQTRLREKHYCDQCSAVETTNVGLKLHKMELHSNFSFTCKNCDIKGNLKEIHSHECNEI